MLKIAKYNTITGEKIDLKELEKYGFIKARKGMTDFVPEVKYWFTKTYSEYECLTVFKDRTLYLGADSWGYSYVLDTLYDLIKDGLVIKEEEE